MSIRCLLLALAFASAAHAQRTFVVPSKALTIQPGLTYFDSAAQSWPFWGTTSAASAGSRVQYLYDASDIPVAAATLTAVAMRSPANSQQLASTFSTQITLSVGPNTASTPSTTFAANHGATTLAFTGAVNMPQTTGSAWPAPWQTPITFSSPFPYVSTLGNSLVIEFETTASSPARTWLVEGYRTEVGNSRTELYQSTCRNSSNQTSSNWSWQPSNLVPGGSLGVSLGGYPINVPSLAINVLFVSASGLGSPIGPFVTPFDLSLVVPAQATCRWAIDIVNAITLPMTYQQSTTSASLNSQPGVPIPNLPFLRNKVLYSQNLAVDVDPNNNYVVFPSIAIRWLIGTNNRVPVGLLRALFNPASPAPATGTATPSEGAAVRFNY